MLYTDASNGSMLLLILSLFACVSWYFPALLNFAMMDVSPFKNQKQTKMIMQNSFVFFMGKDRVEPSLKLLRSQNLK